MKNRMDQEGAKLLGLVVTQDITSTLTALSSGCIDSQSVPFANSM